MNRKEESNTSKRYSGCIIESIWFKLLDLYNFCSASYSKECEIIKYEIAEYSYLSNSERSLKGKLIIMKDMAVVDEKDDVVFTFSLSWSK